MALRVGWPLASLMSGIHSGGRRTGQRLDVATRSNTWTDNAGCADHIGWIAGTQSTIECPSEAVDLLGRTFHVEPAFSFHRANDDIGGPRYRIGRRRLCAEATNQNVRALDFARYRLSGLWWKTSPRSQDTRMPRPGRFPLLSRPARRARHLRRQAPSPTRRPNHAAPLLAAGGVRPR